MSDEIISPRERQTQLGRETLEADLRRTMHAGALNHGWIIAGGDGAGKATLAFRIARGVLDPTELIDDASFNVTPDARCNKLIAQNAHPDLFVAERIWNEKTSKYQSDITVETIRKLTQFLSHTPAMSKARVAIVDRADDLNRNAANALLKVLEEPPANTLLLLLSAAPGRLLPTIRSRCRRLSLRPLAHDTITSLLGAETALDADAASRIADHADGRPGYALRLAEEGGGAALSLADQFLTYCVNDGDIEKVATKFNARTPEREWSFFLIAVLTGLSDAARAGARADAIKGPLNGAPIDALVHAWERLNLLVNRGDALNLDRAQIVLAMGHDLRSALAGN